MKKMILIISICIVSLVILVGIFYLLVISGAIFSFGPNPEKPEITYGEFPFKLVYELDGEIITIEDAAICEFDGFGQLSEAGQYRAWKTHLKSETGESISDNKRGEKTNPIHITLLDLRNDGIYDDFGREVLELYFYGGNGAYYMGDDTNPYARDDQDFTWVDYMYKTVDGEIAYSAFKAEEAYEKFNIRLISWEIAPPIQNTFK